MSLLFFFFQAEDGIRDIGVTGVQTCALPILLSLPGIPWNFQPLTGVTRSNSDPFNRYNITLLPSETVISRRSGLPFNAWIFLYLNGTMEFSPKSMTPVRFDQS